jgi:LacI family transcriptional regulator
MTTINYPGIEMGEVVAKNLIDHLSGKSSIHHTHTIIIKSELVPRESSAKK